MNGHPSIDLSALKPVTKQGPVCPNCRFSVVDGKDIVCRRMPPQVTVLLVPQPGVVMGPKGPEQRMGMAPQPFTAWPVVMKDWHCFEHQPAFGATSGLISGLTPATDQQNLVHARRGVLDPQAISDLRKMAEATADPLPGTVPRMPGDDQT